ncbi:MAG: RES domain-containing protein [Bacteroidetes bacterium]|nr:RES domain-containing protein [Bacteroidota bacterium]
MTVDTTELCKKIEGFMKSHHDNHGLLYDKTTQELSDGNFRVVTAKLKDIPLHRVRRNEADNEFFHKTKDLHYADPEFVTTYGRVNKPGQSMFYCAESNQICRLELLHDYLLKNDVGHERYFTYSQWEINKELNFLVLAVAPSNREISNRFTIRDDCFNFIKSQPTDTQQSYFNLFDLTSNFLLKNAKTDYSVYVVCSAIANFFTIRFPTIDGLIYPTVQGNTGYNFVLRPHTIGNKMILPKKDVYMEKWLVSNKDLTTINPFRKIGHINGDIIMWDK